MLIYNAELPTIEIPDTLRDYQKAGVKWLRTKQRAALYDEAGLGKTRQAIYAAQLPVLVACPSYLMEGWQQEILKAYPEHTVEICDGTATARSKSIERRALWTIINIEMFQTRTDSKTKAKTKRVFDHCYQTLIIDEAHNLRGHSSSQSHNARELAKRIPMVFELTATPIKKECDDLFMQLSILDPVRFSSYYAFLTKYCVTVDNGWTTKVLRPKDPNQLRALVSEYALKRTYEGTGMKRNEPINQTINLNPDQNWYKQYKSLKKNYRLQDVTFETTPSMVRALRTMTFDVKAKVAKRIHEDNPNTVFFVYYRHSAQALGKLLGIPYIDGDMPPRERAIVAKSGGSIVATISSIREGVDLSHLSNAAFIETSYLPGDKNQAIWRLVRWNENIHVVRVFTVIVQHTVDQIINEIIEGRAISEQQILKMALEYDDDTTYYEEGNEQA